MIKCYAMFAVYKNLIFFSFFFLFISPVFSGMGRFGGWSNFYKSDGPSSEQLKNATFDDVPEALPIDSKPRGEISEQSSKNYGILYSAEDKYKLPPVVFSKVYSDIEKEGEKNLKIKPVNSINGLNIVETGTYIAD